MKIVQSLRIAAVGMALCIGAFTAGAEIRHILERGETLESIAKKYGVTTEQIIELNPEAKTFTYVGMELIIPETVATPGQPGQPGNSARSSSTTVTSTSVSTSGSGSSSAQSSNVLFTTSSGSSSSQSAVNVSDKEFDIFSMQASLNYLYCFTGEGGDFKSRSVYGVYAQGASKITDSLGAGLFFGAQANYGCVPSDYAVLQFAIGPTGVLALNSSRTVAFNLPLCLGVGVASNGEGNDTSTEFSFITIPHFSASFNRVVVSLGCQVAIQKATAASVFVGLGYMF